MHSLLPILVFIQARLDADLSLARLASRSGLSSFQFHRLFKNQIGETPKQYTQRLRLEKAALHLSLHDTTVLTTALDVGFQHHETFTRAFQRHFNVTPKEVSRHGLQALPGTKREYGVLLAPSGYELSPSRLVTVKPMHLAFLRHLGPYESVPQSIWDRLQAWADELSLPGPRVLVGLGHDAPSLTPPEKLRFDASIHLPHILDPKAPVAYQHFPGGRFLVTTHVGHYLTLPEAYLRIMERLEQLKDVRFAGLPVLEIYHETKLDIDAKLNHTDLYLPVASRSDPAGLGLL